jgi:hypothetical protein
VEAEFDQDFTDPNGLLAMLRYGQQGAEIVETRATRVRPRVVRLTPVSPLEPQRTYRLVLGPRAAGMADSTWVHRSWSLQCDTCERAATGATIADIPAAEQHERTD